MKKIIITLVALTLVGGGVFIAQNGAEQNDGESANQNINQTVLGKTYDLSREYVLLRYQTDEVLVNAESYESYYAWNQEVEGLTGRWEKLSADSDMLAELAGEMERGTVGLHFIQQALAYSNQEISDVFDNAPAGKKIKTLATFLGVDAKKAFQILKQDQAQVEADAWNEAGDTFQKLETSAVVIKDACKVSGMVGGIIVTGGTAALATAGTAAQAAVLITGADLALEVSSDAARIGLGNHNKVSGIIDSVRVVTEPISSVLAINSVSGKFDALILGLDQFNSAVQEGKVVGVQLPAYTPNKTKDRTPVKVAVLDKNEVETWLSNQGVKSTSDTAQEIEAFMNELAAEHKSVSDKVGEAAAASLPAKTEVGAQDISSSEYTSSRSVVGDWKGILKFTPSQNAEEEQMDFAVRLKADGSVYVTGEQGEFTQWKQEGNVVKLFMTTEEGEGYYEFILQNDTLTFVKLAGPNSEGEWQEDYAGEDFFGGTFYEITLLKQ